MSIMANFKSKIPTEPKPKSCIYCHFYEVKDGINMCTKKDFKEELRTKKMVHNSFLFKGKKCFVLNKKITKYPEKFDPDEEF
jgi:hypothetical protein